MHGASKESEKWVTELIPCYWQDDIRDFCCSKSDIAKAYKVRKNNEPAFIIVMDDSTIDENVLASRNVKMKYKQLKSNCWSARYSRIDMAPTIANQMKRFAEEIEAEIFPAQNEENSII